MESSSNKNLTSNNENLTSNNKNLTSNNENLSSNNENLNPLIKNEILSTLVSFITQLDLVFDYINNEYINKLRDFSTTLNDDITLLNFSETTYNILKQYESNLSYIIMGKHKIKSSDYNFLNNITLFNNILEFNVFQDENKNTKRTIVSYLYNLYMSCFILKFGRQTDTTEFGQNLTSFIENLQKVSQEPTNSKNKKKKHNRHSQHTNNNNMSMNNIMNLINNPSNLNGLDNVFKSLMSNNELMNIANDLSADIQNQNIDPLTLLTSMMSGKPNNQIQNLVNNVTKKIEHKINKGEIDKSLLESQAKNILNQFQTNTTNQNNTPTTTNTTNQNNTPTTTNTTNQNNTANQNNTPTTTNTTNQNNTPTTTNTTNQDNTNKN